MGRPVDYSDDNKISLAYWTEEDRTIDTAVHLVVHEVRNGSFIEHADTIWLRKDVSPSQIAQEAMAWAVMKTGPNYPVLEVSGYPKATVSKAGSLLDIEVRNVDVALNEAWPALRKVAQVALVG